METNGLIWPNFKHIQALMYIIITCKYEKDLIKNNREKAYTPFIRLYHYLLPWKPVVGSGRISNLSKLLCMSSLPASIKRIRWKIAERMWWRHFLHYKSMGFFFRRSRAANSVVHGLISPNFELIQALMYIIITCKYKMNPIKNVWENVMTPFFPL